MNSFLKKAIVYIRVKVFNKIDKKIWQYSSLPIEQYCIYEKEEKGVINKFFPNVDVAKIDETKIGDRFLLEHFRSYIYKIEQRTLVEPLYGWVITDGFKILKKSFPYVDDPWDAEKNKPSLVNYLLPKKIVEIDSCISIRYYWQNYYHFFFDALPQVFVAKDRIPADVPILVPYGFAGIKFIAEFLKLSTFLEGRKIIVQQKDEYYSVRNLYLCKGAFYSDSIYEVVKSFGGLIPEHSDAARKIFVKRGKNRNRSISNIEEIEQVVAEYGYEIIDVEGMNLKEQISLFSNVGTVVGIHGAALSNIIYRGWKPLRLFEILPSNIEPDHFLNICILFNHGYSYIYGQNIEGSKAKMFYVDPVVFREQLVAFGG